MAGLDGGSKIIRHWQDAALSILRGFGVEPHFACLEIDLRHSSVSTSDGIRQPV